MSKPQYVISLFSGAMGLDLGLESQGYKTAVAVEISPVAVATIKLNKPELPVINKSIKEVTTSEILETGSVKKGEVFLVTGGPCCQSFSTAGKRQSISDETKGNLFRDFKRIVKETQPRFFVMENVKGMLSAAVKHRPLDERGSAYPLLSKDEAHGSALKVICAELEELNYHVIFGLLNCADYGVPQKRLRVVFIGSRDGEEIALPKPSHSIKSDRKKRLKKWVSLKNAIGKLSDSSPEFMPFSKDRAKLLGLLKAGQYWRNLPEDLHREALGAAADTWGGRSGFCRRLDWAAPSPTLTTDPTGRATTLCHPTKLRPLSVKEYAKLQQFPKKWKFFGSIKQKYRQIGNAVPVGLGSAVGNSLSKTVATTARKGLPEDAKERLGKVTCSDPVLVGRLKKRKKTQLHPPWKRDKKTLEEDKKWLAAAAV